MVTWSNVGRFCDASLQAAMRAFPRYLLLLLIIVPGVGFAMVEPASRKSYETVSGMPQRDSVRARELNVEALDLLECGKLSQAHQAVDEALIADIDHAPAHNTLGKIYYRKGNYYLAAWEFEFAIRLYPDFPEYHNNLGLVYEAAGKLPEAIKEFEIAANLAPDKFHFVSNLARARMRTEEETPGTRACWNRSCIWTLVRSGKTGRDCI